MALSKRNRRIKIKRRIRKKIAGSGQKPRMSIFRSNKQIYAQFIDDVDSKTIAAVSSLEKEIVESSDNNKTKQAELVGTLAAKVANEKGITEVTFDRNGYLYHGRIKSLADAARKGGLKF